MGEGGGQGRSYAQYWLLCGILLVLGIVGTSGATWAVDVTTQYTATPSGGGYYTGITAPGGYATTTQNGEYTIHNGQLMQAYRTYSWTWHAGSGGNPGYYTQDPIQYGWTARAWSDVNITADSDSSGNATATDLVGAVAGNGGKTVNINSTGTINAGGGFNGALTMYTGTATSGSTLNLGYYGGTVSTGGSIGSSGMIDIGFGTVNQANATSSMAGTVNANTNNTQTIYTMNNGAVTGTVNMNGASSNTNTFNQRAGAVSGNVNINGAGSQDATYNQTGGSMSGTVTVNGAGMARASYNLDSGTFTGVADYNGTGATDTTFNFNLNSPGNATITGNGSTQGIINLNGVDSERNTFVHYDGTINRGTINMNGVDGADAGNRGSQYNTYDFREGTITNGTNVNLNGANSDYNYFVQGGTKGTGPGTPTSGTLNGSNVYMNGAGSTVNYYYLNNASIINNNSKVELDGTSSRYNSFMQSGSSQVQAGTIVKLNGANSQFNQYSISGTGSNVNDIRIDGANSENNTFSQRGGSITGSTIYLNGVGSSYNTYEQIGGSNTDTVLIGDNSGPNASHHGIYYQGGGSKTGAITITGSKNLVWLNNNANFTSTASIVVNSGAGTNSGDNVVVVDLNTPHMGTPNTGYDLNGTISLAGTTTGNNNMIFANGDVMSKITTGGGNSITGSKNFLAIGYTAGQVLSTPYEWYHNDAGANAPGDGTGEDLTGLTGYNPTGSMPDNINQSYFNMDSQIRDTGTTDNGLHLNVKNIVGGGGALTGVVTAGNLYNINMTGGTIADSSIPAWTKEDLSGTNTTQVGQYTKYVLNYLNGQNYLTYSITNAGVVNVGAPMQANGEQDYARVSIGAITNNDTDNLYRPVDLSGVNDDTGKKIPQNPYDFGPNPNPDGPDSVHDYTDFYQNEQAHITARQVNVYANSKLSIHENYDNYGSTSIITNATRNVIDNLNIWGNPTNPGNCNECGFDDEALRHNLAIVTIDRTTINTLTAGGTYDLAANQLVSDMAAGPGPNYSNGAANARAHVIVGVNGILQGFGEITAASTGSGNLDHTPLRPNVIGDVAIRSGGMIRPYDKEMFNHINWNNNLGATYDDREAQAKNLKGVYFEVKGTMIFENAARYSTRLFGEIDGTNTLNIINDGTDVNPGGTGYGNFGGTEVVQRHLGDGIKATEFNFNELKYNSIYNQKYGWNGTDGNFYSQFSNISMDPDSDLGIWTGLRQSNKVQYVPVFGFDYELKSKLDFGIYKGDQTGIDTYYYRVAESDVAIPELAGMPDANHLFNRDILRSDMLGNWFFLKQDDDKGVVLRYRLLAEHPQNGGIAAVMQERNAHEAGLKLDEIRYPFWTAATANDKSLAGVFIKDPTLDNPNYEYHGQDPNLGYNDPDYYNNSSDLQNPYNVINGFSGNLHEFYANPFAYGYTHNPFTNYRNYWVTDIEQFFRAAQLETFSAEDLHRAVRLITAEVYASQASADLIAMNGFINSRERNAVSALYMVDVDQEPVPGEKEQLAADEYRPALYVMDPIRIWASMMGSRSALKRQNDEYGLHIQNHGIQVGVIKERGDLYFGLTGAFTRSTNRWTELQSKNKSNNYMGEALLGYRYDMSFIEASVNGGYMEHKMDRNIQLGRDLNGGAYDIGLDCDPTDNYYNGVYKVHHRGKFNNRVFGGALRVGHQKILMDKWLFLPTLGIRFQDIRNPSEFTESANEKAAFALQFKKGGIKRQSLQIPFMMRLSRGIAWKDSPTIITPEIRGGVTYEALDRNGEADYTWRGNPLPNRVMHAWGLAENRWSYQVGTTLEVSRKGRFYGALNYDLNFLGGKEHSFTHNFSMQAGLNF